VTRKVRLKEVRVPVVSSGGAKGLEVGGVANHRKLNI